MICSIHNCSNKHLAKKLCSKHYYRLKRGQSVIGKSRFDRRPAVIDGDVARIELGNGKGHTIVDKEFAYIDSHNWSLDGYGYPCTWHEGKIVKIHHMIIGKPGKGLVVDHINRDKLDNRVVNLRKVTQKENILNSTNPIMNNWK